MRIQTFDWGDPPEVAQRIREWATGEREPVDVEPILAQVRQRGDEAVLDLTRQLDAPDGALTELRVPAEEAAAALERLDLPLREALVVAAANIRAVAEAQAAGEPTSVQLPEGHSVELRSVPVSAAGIYAPGGRAAYPSSVLMCALPAQVAGVGRIALASPPGPDGKVNQVVLATAALVGIEEIYAMSGAQAIFALAYGTQTIEPVDVIAGPGNEWVTAAKRAVYGQVGIDSLAGPSELMVIVGHEVDAEVAALDLCAQAEHGPDSPLILAAVEEVTAEEIAAEVERLAADRPSVADAPLAVLQVPDTSDALALANAYAPEHLEILTEDAAELAGYVTTAGCVFIGPAGATSFGDYAAGSNHVLPTGGTGRFSGPLGPGTFRRRMTHVHMNEQAAAGLAPNVDEIARAEGFPVHGESATIRAKGKER